MLVLGSGATTAFDHLAPDLRGSDFTVIYLGADETTLVDTGLASAAGNATAVSLLDRVGGPTFVFGDQDSADIYEQTTLGAGLIPISSFDPFYANTSTVYATAGVAVDAAVSVRPRDADVDASSVEPGLVFLAPAPTTDNQAAFGVALDDLFGLGNRAMAAAFVGFHDVDISAVPGGTGRLSL